MSSSIPRVDPLPHDPIIAGMGKQLSLLGLFPGDFDWPACSPGMGITYRDRGGDPSEPDGMVAGAVLVALIAAVERRDWMVESKGIAPDRVRCRWEPLSAWARRTGAELLVTEIECAGCHNKEEVEKAHTTVPQGHRGEDLPIPGYIHCTSCMLRMEAVEAWWLARAEANRQIGRRA